jgi:predicted transcriptional regulator
MSEIKNLCLRLSYEEYVAFDSICKEKGFSKTGKIREFIRNLIKQELPSVKASAGEWAKIEAAIKEIERGEFLTLEELKGKLRDRQMDHRKNRQDSRRKDREPRPQAPRKSPPST